MAFISEETVLEVKRSVDIIEVVSSYVHGMKRAGANYKGLCPFHEEKTPSFNVHPEKQIFKCFGCGKAGDAISFVMEFDKVDYPEAIRILAEKAGIHIKYEDDGRSGPKREDLYHANEWAAKVFQEALRTAPEAEPARQFLVRRGINDEARDLFGLGFAMPSWDYLLAHARKAGITEQVLAAAGLVVARDGQAGWYDRFRNRLTFPIGDARGRTIAFGARTLTDEVPKFINSPETALFSKGRGFYGFHLAKEELGNTRTVYIVEGYMDVIVPHQAGLRGVVATLGTALTPEHLKVLRRYVDKVVLVFDSDAAGQKASERGLDLLLSENLDLFVAELPPGMDPDDVVVKEGPERLRALLQKPREIFEYLMTSLTAKHGGETPSARQRVVEDVLERLRRMPDPIKQEILVQELARRFGLEERTLRARLERDEAEEAVPVEAVAAPAAVPALESAARELLACALAVPAVAERIRREVPADRYPSEATRKVAGVAYGLFDRAGEIKGGDLIALLQDRALMETGAEIVALEMDAESAPRRAEACLDRLAGAEFREGSAVRQAKLRARPGDQKEVDDVLREAMEARRRRPQDRGLRPKV